MRRWAQNIGKGKRKVMIEGQKEEMESMKGTGIYQCLALKACSLASTYALHLTSLQLICFKSPRCKLINHYTTIKK